VVPDHDERIFADGIEDDWEQGPVFNTELDPAATAQVYEGQFSMAVTTSGPTVEFLPKEPLIQTGYEALRFAIFPGEVTVPGFRPAFSVQINGLEPLNLLQNNFESIGVDMSLQQWQVIEVPLDLLILGSDEITSVRFVGNISGTFYLDDIRLVAARPSPGTAVVESQDATVPESFTLSQNYPNPFNPATTIRFDLPRSEEIDLAVYNLTGQKVATLASGLWNAGAYTLRWDGRDDDERELASGVYLYRLQAGERVETRKLLLLR